MKPYQANLINALTLVVMGGWAFASTSSVESLVIVTVGIFFWAWTPKLEAGDPFLAHTVVVVTLILLICLLSALYGQAHRDDSLGGTRSMMMISSCILALAVYIHSFREARKARATA